MGFQIAAIAVVLLLAFSGCIAPGGVERLEIGVNLDSDVFQQMQDVSGTVEIKNMGSGSALATYAVCPSFFVHRVSDSRIFPFPCSIEEDREGPREKTSFDPGESAKRPFSLRNYYNWEDWEFPSQDGLYGLTALPFVENHTSEQVTFSINAQLGRADRSP